MNNSSLQLPTSRRLPLSIWRIMALAWAGLIFYLSTGSFGGSLSAWLLRGILDFLHVSVSHETFEILHFFIRKLAHLTEYFLLTVFLYESFGESNRIAWSRRAAFLSVLGAALYSLTDEIHQSFVGGRTPSLMDCGIDTAGAALGMLFVYGSEKLSQVRKQRAAASV